MKNIQTVTSGLLAVTLVFLFAGTAHSQLSEVEPEFPASAVWDVNLNTGVMMAESELIAPGIAGTAEEIFVAIDDDDFDISYGVSLEANYRLQSGWTAGGQFAWSPMSRDFDAVVVGGEPFSVNQTRDLNLYLYSLNGGYVVSSGRLGLHATVGIGAATQSYDESQFLVDGQDIFTEESNTNFLTPVTLNVKYAVSPNVSLNAVTRDYIVYGGGDVSDTTNNFYIGVGVSYLF